MHTPRKLCIPNHLIIRLYTQLMTVYDGPPGKPALTHVRTLAFDGKLSASLVRIETGR